MPSDFTLTAPDAGPQPVTGEPPAGPEQTGSATDAEITSPHGGPVLARTALFERFAGRMTTNASYSRKVVSYQGNRDAPGLRWMKYKEGFSSQLVADIMEQEKPGAVLDPFAGICTTPLVASRYGGRAMGMDVMPVGILVGSAIAAAANGQAADEFSDQANALLKRVRGQGGASGFAFPHVRITAGAFPEETEQELARARKFLAAIQDSPCRTLLNMACMSVLEEISFTRKDGQYLRWDRRARRALRSSVDKGPIPLFSDALENRISAMLEDAGVLQEQYGGGRRPDLVTGSCLELLRGLPADSFDMVITSPPYANRYDYTRTYALELAWMGFGQEDFSALRQRMLSATVENRRKADWLQGVYGAQRQTLDRAMHIHAGQEALHEVLDILLGCQHELSNRNVIRLIDSYFFEMAVVIAELGRVVRPGGAVFMVNDNVQYHGEELPVDFILSDFAEQAGFHCEHIWKLPRGKGNSSQQMARFGRKEMRKCVYKWVRAHRSLASLRGSSRLPGGACGPQQGVGLKTPVRRRAALP